MFVSFLGLARIVAEAESDESKAVTILSNLSTDDLQSGYRILSPCLLAMKYTPEETMTILTRTND